MKKVMLSTLVLLTCFIAGPRPAFADSLLDQFYVGFVGNAKFAIESTTDGRSHGEFLDNFVEIGKLNDAHVAALDFGVLGDFLPDNQQFKSADWTTGAKLHLSPIIKSYVKLPAGWEFINALELDARASYNWTEHHPYYGICAAYPWK